jgi:hypothetical protein
VPPAPQPDYGRANPLGRLLKRGLKIFQNCHWVSDLGE